jgi:tetratricopeptide (TPR) repeat protein
LKNRAILISILVAVSAFVLLYFGCNRQSPDQKAKSISRSLTSDADVTNTTAIVQEAKKTLTPQQIVDLDLLSAAFEKASPGANKVSAMKKLAGFWYQVKRPDISGSYALEIAKQTNTAEAWSIAGTTCVQAARLTDKPEDKRKQADLAYSAFDKAAAIEPDNWQHQLNQAVCLAENPLPNEPMKGILSLLDLDKKHPNQAPILLVLGRLGLQTGQFEKAIGRLEKVLALDPKNIEAHCLLAEAYNGAGQTDKAKAASDICSKSGK